MKQLTYDGKGNLELAGRANVDLSLGKNRERSVTIEVGEYTIDEIRLPRFNSTLGVIVDVYA